MGFKGTIWKISKKCNFVSNTYNIQHYIKRRYFQYKTLSNLFFGQIIPLMYDVFNFRKAKKSGSNVFALFSQRQIQEFKEAFGIMDADKDGLLSSSDIVAAFNSVGKSVSDGEAQGMLSEAPGPVNFTQMVMLFAEKMAGGEFAKKKCWCSSSVDKFGFLYKKISDNTIAKSFGAFEFNSKINTEKYAPLTEKRTPHTVKVLYKLVMK